MKPQFGRNDSHLAYLEPPHSHDPTSVSDVATLPLETLSNLPDAVQTALYNLQQSTSIVYASYIRLQDSFEERFERLLPSIDEDGEFLFSEPSFLNYANSLCAERTYLLSDAHPDWRHKASLARVAVQPYFDLLINPEPECRDAPSNILEWWSCLQSAVASWCEYAKVVHVPDYEDTMGEYLSIQKQLPSLAADLDDTPLETPQAVSTPNIEQEPDCLELKDKDFSLSIFPDHDTSYETIGLGLKDPLEIDGFAVSATSEVLLQKDERTRDERKDSGVGIA